VRSKSPPADQIGRKARRDRADGSRWLKLSASLGTRYATAETERERRKWFARESAAWLVLENARRCLQCPAGPLIARLVPGEVTNLLFSPCVLCLCDSNHVSPCFPRAIEAKLLVSNAIVPIQDLLCPLHRTSSPPYCSDPAAGGSVTQSSAVHYSEIFQGVFVSNHFKTAH